MTPRQVANRVKRGSRLDVVQAAQDQARSVRLPRRLRLWVLPAATATAPVGPLV
ncbi:MAG: hypothetical protein ACRDJN_01385 [Chloroflexota bacterium]